MGKLNAFQFEFVFRHELYNKVRMSYVNHLEIEESVSFGGVVVKSLDELKGNIDSARNVFHGWLDVLVDDTNSVEFPEWFDRNRARQLKQDSDFDWKDAKKYFNFYQLFDGEFFKKVPGITPIERGNRYSG